MKIIVTHHSPDWDAITSVWVLKRFLPGWEEASVEFVVSGGRSPRSQANPQALEQVIEHLDGNEVIHVDTGMGPLDHHQTSDRNVCGASRSWDYVREQREKNGHQLTKEHVEAINRIIKVVTDHDHFREVYWPDAAADHYEFSLIGLLEGLKYAKPDYNQHYVDFGMECLDAMLHQFEDRIWAEREINEHGTVFETKYGKGIGIETMNEKVLKLAQRMGYVLVVKKDPRQGHVRIKTLPETTDNPGINLTLAHEQLKKMDPNAVWFLHVSKKMLLNGSTKNPAMTPTTLSLQKVIDVLKSIY